MDSDIVKSSAPALNMIGMAFKEIDYEEYSNPKAKRLSTIQRNRMALSFLEMNNQPEKYQYFMRFKDKAKEKHQPSKKKKNIPFSNKELDYANVVCGSKMIELPPFR